MYQQGYRRWREQQEAASSLFVQQIYTYLKETHSKVQMLEARSLAHIPWLYTSILSMREDVSVWCCVLPSNICHPFTS